MQHIKKIISLEPYKSRQHGIIPSYESGYDTVQTYNPQEDNFTNYGAFPMNVDYNGECLPYPILISRYHFCKKYKDLLSLNNGCIMKIYKDAMEYYLHEVQYKTIDLEEYYKQLDVTFEEYGGDGFIKFCETRLFPTFVFSEQVKKEEIVNAWNITRMSHLDVKKWIDRLEKLRDSEDECDKCKYQELFGEDMIDIFNNWLNSLSSIESCGEPYIEFPILFTTSIENLGEMTIFSKDWNEGENYRSENDFEYGGSVIFNEDVYVFNQKGVNEEDFGSLYSETYKEIYFPNSSAISGTYMGEWYDKTKKFKYSKEQWIKKGVNENDFETYSNSLISLADSSDETRYYGINQNGSKIIDPLNNADKMALTYEIDYNDDLGFFYINGNLYRVFKSEYIEYKLNNYLVKTLESSNFKLKFSVIDSVKVYSVIDDEGNEYIKYGKQELEIKEEQEFIIINGKPILVNGDFVELYDNKNGYIVKYYKFDGITMVDGVNIFINDNKSISFNREQNQNDSNYSYINDDTKLTYVGLLINENEYDNLRKFYKIEGNILYFYKPFVLYDAIKTTGRTESKLSSLVDYNVAYDELGNKMPFSFNKDEDGKTIPIEPNDMMDLLYHIGNTSELTKLELDNENEVYFGNIITDISCYYLDGYGNKLNLKSDINSIEAIENVIKDFEETNEKYTVEKNLYLLNDLKCDITYYMGGLITKNGDEYEYSCLGVKYIDTVSLVKKDYPVYMNEIDKIMVSYYDFEYDMEFIVNNDYNNSESYVRMSYFEIEKRPQSIIEGVEYVATDIINDNVFREEYKLGIASKEKIDADVYIDRGIASAFEKHLKILEVASFEALENLGNGYFNIRKN